MARFSIFLLFLTFTCGLNELITELPSASDDVNLLPTVMIVILARNKGHVLPHTLALLENLDYPKNRISLWIRSDHNEDETEKILTIWSKKWKDRMKGNHKHDVYHSLDIVINDQLGSRQPDQEKGPLQWSQMRFEHVMGLREEGLNAARKSWADWVWQLDADVFLTNRNILKTLVLKSNFTVVAPVLSSMGLYSNFWGGMTDEYYYERTENYEKILHQKKNFVGCHSVPMIHSSVLINLRRKDSLHLTYMPEKVAEYDGPFDDIITFAVSADFHDIDMIACNDDDYGYVMLPQDEESSLKDDLQNFSNLKMEIMAYEGPLISTEELSIFVRPPPKKSSLGVDKVYMINLERRADRRMKMDLCLSELGIDYEWVKAVDGKKEINEDFLRDHGVVMMPEFKEPYHGRPITYGEIGCFMSHWKVWNDVIEKKYSKVVVFEDDVRFEPYFRSKMQRLLAELDAIKLNWDLIFLGRKILNSVTEPWLENSDMLLHVNYTYWTLGYMLSQTGAQKLVAEEPLSKIVPVDEYLPIMYDRHPREDWKSFYQNRDLKAFSVQPLYIYPTHYTGEEGYLSDTEDSLVMAAPSCGKQNCEPSNATKDEL